MLSMRTASRSSNPNQTKALEAARQKRDSAMHRLENMTSTTTTGDDADANANNSSADDHSDASVELGRRISATPQHGRLTNLSGLDLDDDMFADLNTTLDTVGPASAQRSNETSTLSTSHFRRRPRAGSFLSRDDGPLRPSSRAGPNTPGISSTFNIGVFKRRAREPSILGTAQKQRPQRPEPEEELESSEEEEEEAAGEDGFAPEAESTPFKHSKRRSGAAVAAEPQEAPAETSSDANANPRKRKSDEGHAQRLRSSPHSSRQSGGPIESIEQSDSELSELASREPSLPPLARDQVIPTTPVRQEDDEEVLAPPLSSDSSEDGQEIWPPLQSLAKGRHRRAASALRRTPVPNDSTSDMSSPPSLTYSPNYPETSPPPTTKQTTRKINRRKAAAVAAPPKPAPKITTADLAGMLPRRRRRPQRHAAGDGDPFGPDDSDAEVDASGLANDEDELYHLDVRARRRPAAGSASRSGGADATNNRGRRAASKQAPAATTTASSGSKTKAAGATRRRRTYGRSSDKENQNDEEEEGGGDESLEPDGDGDADLDIDDSQALVARVGTELKDAKRKFQEVDKWALEYEEMTQSSSPRGAR
ncbi:hypothetical protein SLS62_010600 [Diatrype stigma]|uniref:Uncharacterized protein n=1 Tax=Diatrype stigma TaxID=117547 RepID=A0AAN9U8Y8_9PEZI